MALYWYFTIFQTAAGWVGVLGSGAGLRCITLPRHSEKEAAVQLGESLLQAEPAPRRFQDLRERLTAYFSGSRVSFPGRLDLSAATPFQRQVWAAARLIPFGETRSYAWVAGQIGSPRAARAVGQALGRNPLPIIVPCHRVVAGDGGLGGFSGGLSMKRFLLRLEGSVAFQ